MLLTYEYRMHLYLWRRANRTHPVTGLAPISLRIEIEGFDRSEFSTGVACTAEQWSQDMKRLEPVKGMSKEARELLLKQNSRLSALLLSAERAYDLLRSQGHNPSPASIRELLRGKPARVRRLLDAIELLQDTKRQKGMAQSTLDTLRNVQVALSAYLKKQHTQALPISSVTVEWMRGWERWLIREDYAPSSIRLYISAVLQSMREAAHEGWIAQSAIPAYQYQSASYEPTKRYLTLLEVEQLQRALPGLPKGKRRTSIMFIFCCYTGLSYVDYCRVAEEPAAFFALVQHPITAQLVRGIRLVRQKTQRKTAETWTPLLPPATAFIDGLTEKLPIRSPTAVNEDLKELAREFTLSLPDLKFKDSRSTFAQWTRQTLDRGVASELARHTEKVAEKHYSNATSEELLRKLYNFGAELSYN